MDSYEFDAIKIEKVKAMHRYRAFRKVATIVRTLEVFVVVGLISWSIFRSSVYLPVAFEVSGAFLRRVCSLLFCPHFVFFLGNAIIIALFANSREKTSADDSTFSEKSATGEIFSGELRVKERESEPEVLKFAVEVPAPAPPTPETAIVQVSEDREQPEVIAPAEEIKVIEKSQKKTYRRSQSTVVEKLIIEEENEKENEKIELRRSRTVPRRKSRSKESAMARRMSDVDDLSNEEFRRRVEAFIEKQQRFLREESKSVVLTN